MKVIMKAAICAALVLGPVSVAKADAIDDAIDARLAFYNVNKHYFGGLIGMVKGDVEYDAETAMVYADIMDYLSKMNTNSMWPEGSSNADRPGKTRTLPKLWAEMDGVIKLHNDWEVAATNLKATAGDGRAALTAAMNQLNDTCNACHDEYRAKEF